MGAVSGSAPGIVIAVDGGGSKTDAVALDLDGTVLASARGTTSSPHIIGMGAAADLVDELIASLVQQTGDRPIVQTNIYLSGLDLPAELAAFGEHIAGLPWAGAVVDNDLFALLRAGTSEPDAVAVVCGTGINCVGVRSDGAVVRYPSLGMSSGDWGGGWHLGEQALWHAARAVDGRGPSTALVQAIPAVYGLESVQDVIEALHFERIPNSDLALISPAVFDAARAGDGVAIGLVDRQAEEIVVFAVTTLRRLGLLDRPTPVVLGGGVIGARDARLMQAIEEGLADRAPLAHIELVTAAPILGAGLLALEAAGADADALERARGELGARQAALPVG
ncbi:N-acetylglucosamine kinase [Leifsonia poae]|uniref:Kinase n=1 Tax=Leifsonia poae TaxID=110933 RepID=A0A9W6HBY9_9MICO|nr:BadF/BadG/BcrA/BcrD ATPase family protein [Leifsonia poae]GLJ77268.1 kinase [Leifsonia poae]